MPHTTAPTSRPATHEPCQRDSVTAPCVVTGFGKPMRVKVSFGEHPARASSKTASAPTRTALARRLRGARVRWAVPRGSVPRGAGPRPPGAACRRIRVKGAPSQQRRPAACYLLQAPVYGLLQRVVETVSRAAAGSQGTPAVRGRSDEPLCAFVRVTGPDRGHYGRVRVIS